MADIQASLIEITVQTRGFARILKRVSRAFDRLSLTFRRAQRRNKHRLERRARVEGRWPIVQRSPHRRRRKGR